MMGRSHITARPLVQRRVPTFSIPLERVRKPAQFAWRVTIFDAFVWLGAAAICGMAAIVGAAAVAGFLGRLP